MLKLDSRCLFTWGAYSCMDAYNYGTVVVRAHIHTLPAQVCASRVPSIPILQLTVFELPGVMHGLRTYTSQPKTVWWMKLNFLGLFTQCGNDQ